MTAALHLTITTPATVLVDSDDVSAVRAEDESGSFGILPGHADLLTILAPTVVRWRTAAGAARFCAVRGGVLTVSRGRQVAIACREGVLGDALDTLEAKVRAVRAQQLDADRRAHVEQVRLHALAVRQLLRYLRPDSQQRAEALAPADEHEAAR
jgi:F-type H+-transporting ATPase subunit epsilon